MDIYYNKIQALMDDVYTEWQKPESGNKGKWDILEGFSPAHKVAVAFGNFNYQVENGGLSQWIYNGYFQDDAEKFTEFLEKGVGLDNRCKEILDMVYKIDQYARETECDRFGNFHEPHDEDGESQFIGDMVNCEKFDSWYYENCGKEDWWKIVSDIIDKVEGRNISPVNQDERDDGEDVSAKPTPPPNKDIDEGNPVPTDSFLYSVEYNDWNMDFSDLIPRTVLMHGRNEAEAIENAKQKARSDSRDFKATRIDTVAGMKISVTNPDAKIQDDRTDNPPQLVDEAEETAVTPTGVYIENAHNANIGGFTMPLPTTREDLQPFLEGAEISDWHDIKLWEITSDINGLGEKLYDIISENGVTPSTLDELNYLAAKLEELGETGREILPANIQAGKNCGSIAEMINLAHVDNINRFDCYPAFSPEQYGDFLVNNFLHDAYANSFNRLEKSEDTEDRNFAAHIEMLEKHADLSAFGRATAKEENGIFTKQGYLVGGDGMQTLYRDSLDIPDQYRLFTEPGKVPEFLMKIDDANIPEAIMKLHAVGSRSVEYAADNVKTFLNEHNRLHEHNSQVEHIDGNLLYNHYLLILNRSDINISPTLEAYKAGSDASKFALRMTEEASQERADIRIFAVRVNSGDVENGVINADIRGDLIELNPQSLHTHITRNAVMPDRVDAIHDGGEKKSYDLLAWSELLKNQQGDAGGLFSYHYADNSLKEAANSFSDFMSVHETASVAKSFEEHLPRINAAYSEAQARPDMIFIANEAAREILARGDADVYRVFSNDTTVKLTSVDAARTAIFSQYHDLAINHKDAAGLEAWAKRKVSDVVRKMEKQTERDTHKKSHEEL
jgi:hypothetical protein